MLVNRTRPAAPVSFGDVRVGVRVGVGGSPRSGGVWGTLDGVLFGLLSGSSAVEPVPLGIPALLEELGDLSFDHKPMCEIRPLRTRLL